MLKTFNGQNKKAQIVQTQIFEMMVLAVYDEFAWYLFGGSL